MPSARFDLAVEISSAAAAAVNGGARTFSGCDSAHSLAAASANLPREHDCRLPCIVWIIRKIALTSRAARKHSAITFPPAAVMSKRTRSRVGSATWKREIVASRYFSLWGSSACPCDFGRRKQISALCTKVLRLHPLAAIRGRGSNFLHFWVP